VPLLTLDNVSLAFGYLPLLEGADLRIDAGERIALIGRNGSGKSSLLKVLAGDVLPDGGQVWRTPGLRTSRLEQDVSVFAGAVAEPGADRTVFDEVASGLGELGALVAEYHQAAMAVAERPGDAGALSRLGLLQHQLEERDGWRLEQKVEMVVSRLSLPADRRVRELSGGWQRRTLLGRALVSEPDLLLLDEPTNHLDIDAIRWLEDALRAFAGALLFVTHDRAFLASLATRIVELDRGTLTSWPGSYGSFLEKKAAALDAEAREIERLDKKLEVEEAWLRQGVKARRTRNEGRVRDLLALRARRAAHRGQEGEVRLAIDGGEATGKVVFEAERVSLSFGGVPIVREYSQRILRGDRVGLIGPNGSGKTTLLRLLVGELEPDSGVIRRGTRLQLAYFDQQREQLHPDRTVADSVNDGNTTVVVGGEPRHIMGYLADFLFPRERALSPVRSLSGGERNRLMLARLFARPANVLVLDEPTNDLDIETLELLEDRIGSFEGTVLLVSHDRMFLDNLVTSTLAFEGGGRVVESVGGYEDYLRQSAGRSPLTARRSPDLARDSKAAAQALQRLRPAPSRASGSPRAQGRGASESEREPSAAAERESAERHALGVEPQRDQEKWGPASSDKSRHDLRKKLTYKESKELTSLPAHVEALEAEQARLQQEAAGPGFYKETPDHIRAVLARIEAIGPELEAALARWVELEERQASSAR
jgi:ABC transport system ATP-binding/permease protein